eukprot:1781977-Pleurochrysis_carterae.AAC.1
MQHARSRPRTASAAAKMAAAMLKQCRHVHIQQIGGSRDSFRMAVVSRAVPKAMIATAKMAAM